MLNPLGYLRWRCPHSPYIFKFFTLLPKPNQHAHGMATQYTSLQGIWVLVHSNPASGHGPIELNGFSRRRCTHFQYIFTLVTFFPTKRTCPWHGHTIHPITKNVAFGSLKSTKWACSCGIYKFLRLGMHQFSTHLDPFRNMYRHITQSNMGQRSQYLLKHCTTIWVTCPPWPHPRITHKQPLITQKQS
jgi:hypothetical protein